MIKLIDDRRAALIFKLDLLIPYLCDLFYEELKKSIKSHGRFNIALAGGSTPKKLYQAICQDPRAKSAPWSSVFVFYGDERAVPLDHEESNYKMSVDAGFNHLKGIHLLPMPAHLKTEAAAEDYQKHLPPHLDLIFLGMGDDGHTASLFPGDPMCEIKDKYVAYGFIEAKKSYRMTLSFPYINKSSKIVILVVGLSKKDKIKQVLSEDGKTNPIYHIGTKSHKAYYVLDEEAACLL
jgi:6-phosphogluconolactonase